MPFFRVVLSGSGISYPFEDESEQPVIGFFTSLVVKAPDLAGAHRLAKDLILAQWCEGGSYATANRGAPPSIVIENSFPIGLFQGIFGRKRAGYTFYSHDD
jgi:hypothetical protein